MDGAFAPKAGKYTQPQMVTISDALVGATIYYTTDGTVLTTSSPVYTGPISVGGHRDPQSGCDGDGLSSFGGRGR